MRKAGFVFVVGIQESDQRSRGLLRSSVSRDRDAVVLLPDDPDPWVSDPLDEPGAGIARAVIHDHDLEVLERLRQDGTDRAADMPFLVVERDDDRNDRFHATAL